MSDGFAIYSLDHPESARRAHARIVERIKKEERDLRLAKDWDDFKQRVGRLTGLEAALLIIEQLAKETDNRGSKDARRSP